MKDHALRLTALFLALFVALSFCSCRGEGQSMHEKITGVKKTFGSSLRAVGLYSSAAEEGYDGYIDQGLISAMLGDDGEYPAEMSGCSEYAFLCASGVEICEVWALRCRTYSYARAVYALFEKRLELLSSPDYESDSDAAAVAGAALVRDGKCVYFAVTENGAEIVGYLCSDG